MERLKSIDKQRHWHWVKDKRVDGKTRLALFPFTKGVDN